MMSFVSCGTIDATRTQNKLKVLGTDKEPRGISYCIDLCYVMHQLCLPCHHIGYLMIIQLPNVSSVCILLIPQAAKVQLELLTPRLDNVTLQSF